MPILILFLLHFGKDVHALLHDLGYYGNVFDELVTWLMLGLVMSLLGCMIGFHVRHGDMCMVMVILLLGAC